MKIPPSQITLKQLPFWNQLYIETLPYLEQGYDYPVFAETSVASLVEKITSFYGECQQTWLIQVGATIVGIFAVGRFPTEINGSNDWYETIIYIHEEHRRQGIAKTLTASAAQAFKNDSQSNFMVEVRMDNFVSIKSHQNIFPEISVTEVNYETYSTVQWLLPIDHNFIINGSHRWLTEEIGLGILPKMMR